MRIHLHGLLAEKGGAARVVDMLARGLAGNGHEVRRTCEIPEGGAAACRPEELGAAADGSDLVHVHGSSDYAGCLNSLAGMRGRVIVTLHDCRPFTAGCPFPLDCREWMSSCGQCPRGYSAPDRGADSVAEALRALDALVVSPSRWMAEPASGAFPGVNVRIIPNGVDWPDALCGKREARRAIGIDPDARLLLFAAHGGVNAEYKSGDRWLELWREAERAVPGSVCVMVGGERSCRKGNLLELPYMAEKSMRMFFRAADIFAYPTRADNHPLAVLEAMSEGAACQAFAAGGLPEQIEEGWTGFLVPEGDWTGYKKKLAALLSSPRRTREVGMNAFAANRKRFSAERMVSDYLSLYFRVCREPVTTS